MVKIAPLQTKAKIILGIDPGTVIMGYGLISADKNEIALRHMGVLKLSSRLDAYEKLQEIHHTISLLIQEYKPESFAIEAPFFGKNVQSMLKLGRAQGVAIAAAMQAGLSIHEYSPRKIKQSITGNGNASKEQVLSMLQRLLQFTESPQYLDATDALSVALCHHFQQNTLLSLPGKGTTAKNWKDFISNNPGRVI